MKSKSKSSSTTTTVEKSMPVTDGKHDINNRRLHRIINHADDSQNLKHQLGSNVISLKNYLNTSESISGIKKFTPDCQANIEKIVTTIMFTDIVKSTQRSFEIGDLKWIKLLQAHNNIVRLNLAMYTGKELAVIGDSFFVCFNSTVQAINCAQHIQSDMKKINLPIRIGIHTGEVLLLNESEISGLSIHIASRVTAKARAHQTVVSQTVKDIVAGSKIIFKNLGFYTLKGLPDEWNLHLVTGLG